MSSSGRTARREDKVQVAYTVEISYFENPKNLKKYVTVREENAPPNVVDDMLSLILERAASKEIVLKHIMVYIPQENMG